MWICGLVGRGSNCCGPSPTMAALSFAIFPALSAGRIGLFGGHPGEMVFGGRICLNERNELAFAAGCYSCMTCAGKSLAILEEKRMLRCMETYVGVGGVIVPAICMSPGSSNDGYDSSQERLERERGRKGVLRATDLEAPPRRARFRNAASTARETPGHAERSDASSSSQAAARRARALSRASSSVQVPHCSVVGCACIG